MNRPYRMQTLKMPRLETLAVGTKEIASSLGIMRDRWAQFLHHNNPV